MSTTDTRPLRLVVVSAGTSVPSSTRMLADRLAAATGDVLSGRGQEVTTTVVEVRDLAHEVVDATVTGVTGERLKAALDALDAADGVVLVTPTFNQSFAGVFKSFVDVIRPGALAGVPVALAATGGTARHSLAIDYALRPLLAYMKADVVPTSVFAASEDFGSASTASDPTSLSARVGRVGLELAEYMLRHAGVTAGAVEPTRAADEGGAPVRGRTEAADEYEDFVPMSELLGRSAPGQG